MYQSTFVVKKMVLIVLKFCIQDPTKAVLYRMFRIKNRVNGSCSGTNQMIPKHYGQQVNTFTSMLSHVYTALNII